MAGKYDPSRPYGGLVGYRQRIAYAALVESESRWITPSELAKIMYGAADPQELRAVYLIIYRLRRAGVPVISKRVLSGTPTGYKLQEMI